MFKIVEDPCDENTVHLESASVNERNEIYNATNVNQPAVHSPIDLSNEIENMNVETTCESSESNSNDLMESSDSQVQSDNFVVTSADSDSLVSDISLSNNPNIHTDQTTNSEETSYDLCARDVHIKQNVNLDHTYDLQLKRTSSAVSPDDLRVEQVVHPNEITDICTSTSSNIPENIALSTVS